MNMLMSFFTYVSLGLDIRISYQLFKGLINKMLRSVFLHGLRNMRVHFYTLERFIALILPDLQAHWRKLKIEIGQFATV
jgi:Rab-GTPase-TBC domain